MPRYNGQTPDKPHYGTSLFKRLIGFFGQKTHTGTIPGDAEEVGQTARTEEREE
jgi:hypothetical protein